MSAENNLQFIDTNVLVYAHDHSAGTKHTIASDLIAQLWQTRQGCLSTQVLQEFYTIVTRKVARPLAAEEAAQIIADLATWAVHRPSVASILHAIRVQACGRISFWDAMIVASAAEMGCATLWSEDLNPGQAYEAVTVVNPFIPNGR